MQSRNKRATTTRRRKIKKRSFLTRRFLKIPIWIWLVLLVIGLVNSSGDNTSTSPSVTPTSTVETLASIAPEVTIETTPTIEPTTFSSIESTTSVPTSEPIVEQSITAAPTNTPVPTTDPTQYVLRQGDKNDDVRQLQKRLIVLGYLDGSADGDFGPKTEKAVLAYQKAAGITATGECDYYTYKSITSVDAPEAPKPIATEKPVTNSNDFETTYIGNKNTKKFHYASCSSVDDMKESNKVPLSSRDAAISNNYVPCKRCTP